MRYNAFIFTLTLIVVNFFLAGCWGVREYRVPNDAPHSMQIDRKLPGSVNVAISVEPVYNYELGNYDYKLYLEQGVKKHYQAFLSQCFQGGIKPKPADVNLHVTALDVSIFPIAGIIIDIRLFFKVEIFDKEMQKQKTVMVYGFGSAPDGNKALEKAITNSCYQLLPDMEELFVR